ncbi:SIS domain-containing protein [Enterococcus faecalis]
MFPLTDQQLKERGAQITTAEICQQPELWQELFSSYMKKKCDIQAFLDHLKKQTSDKIRVIFTGAGTSQYIGDVLAPYLRRKGENQRFTFESIGTTDIVAAPLAYLNPDEVTLLVSFARSGNSPESVATVQLANQLVKHIYHLTITCAADGQLAQIAETAADNFLFLMPVQSNDQGFAMTSSFTCMALAGLLVFDLADVKTKEQYISAICRMGAEVIEKAADLVKQLATAYQRIVYLGSGSLAGLAREAQLKVLELTAGKIATAFDSSMGFRHGPKSFVDETTLVVVFTSNDVYTRQYDLDILNEIDSDQIAATVMSVGQEEPANNFTGVHFTFSEGVLLPESYLALPDVMVAQVIALHSSLQVGNTPDTPSPSGTVNRVVKGVSIHTFQNNGQR